MITLSIRAMIDHGGMLPARVPRARGAAYVRIPALPAGMVALRIRLYVHHTRRVSNLEILRAARARERTETLRTGEGDGSRV